MPKCDFNKVANHILARLFSCKFALYFQNTFSKEHLWRPSIFKEHLCKANCVQKGCSYKHLANVSQKNSYLLQVHRAQSEFKITVN